MAGMHGKSAFNGISEITWLGTTQHGMVWQGLNLRGMNVYKWICCLAWPDIT
jgi:hypothetical protein